jgi:hypothetical protein
MQRRGKLEGLYRSIVDIGFPVAGIYAFLGNTLEGFLFAWLSLDNWKIWELRRACIIISIHIAFLTPGNTSGRVNSLIPVRGYLPVERANPFDEMLF